MAQRIIPVDATRADWPRLVAESVKKLLARMKAVETATSYSTLGNFANDAAAAAGGVAIGSLYRNGSVVQVRVV